MSGFIFVCTHGLLLLGLRESYRVTEIKIRLDMCKVSTLPESLQSPLRFLLNNLTNIVDVKMSTLIWVNIY